MKPTVSTRENVTSARTNDLAGKFTEVTSCRVCGNTNLIPVLDLGVQELTGVFPRSRNEVLTAGPLVLVKCHDAAGEACGLVQLKYSYSLSEMYGMNYGYRSGLNRSMVEHLRSKVQRILAAFPPQRGDLILDIGSNDATLLKGYPANQYQLVGFDPTGVKFADYYPKNVRLIPEFFSAKALREHFHEEVKVKIVTSIAMFYDLDAPVDFMREIADVLADDGIWVFEQSYLSTMLERNAYDTVCHEHLEYYGVQQVKYMATRAGLKILDIELNDVNGGSFSVTAAKESAPYPENIAKIEGLIRREQADGLHTLAPYEAFRDRMHAHRAELLEFFAQARREGHLVLGYGASTKGNVLLQFCGLGPSDLPAIGEINEDKFGAFTPGTMIPIISEQEMRAMRPDVLFVLPWHFRAGIIERERDYLRSGGALCFPLPTVSVVRE